MNRRLLDWYGSCGRDLPWRGSRDPYRIWLSEIMLQQTTVAAVVDYYRRFLEHFPDLQALAAAPLTTVLELWAGLGYYSRARNLHRTARLLVDDYGGEFPTGVDALQRLPGVGRSTAGAIAALAFDRPEPILDGNVRRVLCRLLAVREPARDRQVEQRLWQVAAQLVPEAAAHDYTQAIMDLGATVCLPKSPACESCPLRDLCQAYAQGATDAIPVTAKRPAVPIRQQAIVLIEQDDALLVRRRPEAGLLGGMLEFPTVDIGNNDPLPAVRELLSGYGCHNEPVALGHIRHLYSHFRLEASVYTVSGCSPQVGELFRQNSADLDRLALHGAHKKALALRRNRKAT